MSESPVYNLDFGTETREIILKTLYTYIIKTNVCFSDKILIPLYYPIAILIPIHMSVFNVNLSESIAK